MFSKVQPPSDAKARHTGKMEPANQRTESGDENHGDSTAALPYILAW
jgi:hypothetical protein